MLVSKGTSGVLWPWERTSGTMHGFIFLFKWLEECKSQVTVSTLVGNRTEDDIVNAMIFAIHWFPTLETLTLCFMCSWTTAMWMHVPWFTWKMSLKALALRVKDMQLAMYPTPPSKPRHISAMSGQKYVTSPRSSTDHIVTYMYITSWFFELVGSEVYPIGHEPWVRGEMGGRQIKPDGSSWRVWSLLLQVLPNHRINYDARLHVWKVSDKQSWRPCSWLE